MKYLKHFIFAGIMGSLIVTALSLILKYPTSLLLLVLCYATVVFVLLSFYFFVKKTRSWKEPIGLLTPILFLSNIGLIEIIEHPTIQKFVVVFSALIFGILYGAGVTHGDTLLSLQKPYRRFVMASWVYSIFGICSFIFALPFFINVPVYLFILLLLCGGSIMAMVAVLIWQMYFPRPKKVFLLWGILIGFVGIELLWALHFLPLGYLTLSMFVTWSWYLVVLLSRFHWDENGVQWKKQIKFFLTNAILFIILVLFFVRWI